MCNTKVQLVKFRDVSAEVLDAIARALHLDEAERAHLFDLAGAADTRRRQGR
jgi:hypothetical protein